MNEEIIQSSGNKKWLIFFAWFSILMVSDLPDIFFKYLTGGPGLVLLVQGRFSVPVSANMSAG